MLHSSYNTPSFSSAERLAALAKYVSDVTDNKIVKQIQNNHNVVLGNSNNQRNESYTLNVDNTINQQCETSDIENDNTTEHSYTLNVDNTINQQCETSDIENDNTTEHSCTIPDTNNVNIPDSNNIHFGDITSEKECTEIQDNNVNKNLLFTVSSAGFHNGDFAEFSLGQRVFIPKKSSKRGITVLYLTSNFTAFHAWNFDFYKAHTKIATNSNFISLLRKLPGNTYFAMSIKDDAYKNLFEGTKNFLTKIIGCKSIWKLNYRNSWCVIVYKKTEKSFEVITEGYNPAGIAEVQHLILDSSTHNSLKGTYMNLPDSEKNLPLSILKSGITNFCDEESTSVFNNTVSDTEKNEYNQSLNTTKNKNESNVNFSKVSMIKIMEPSGKILSLQPQPYIVSPSEKAKPLLQSENNTDTKMTKSSQNILNDTMNKVTNEVQELKKLVLEQTNLIKQLLEANTSNKS
jgi:hypothetical protein